MSRLRRVLVLVVPALVAGALVATASLGQAQPTPRPAPAPAPAPAKPPRRPTAVVVGGPLAEHVQAQVRAEISRAMAELEANPDIPPKVRAKVLKALGKLQRTDVTDLAKLGDALRGMTDELEGLTDQLEDLPDIQGEIDRALRSAGLHGGHGAIVIGSDDDSDLDDLDIDVDVDLALDDQTGAWTVPPVPPAPPAPPAPPVVGRHGVQAPMADDADPLDALDDLEVDIDLDDVKVSPDQGKKLREILKVERDARVAAASRIEDLSRDLKTALADVNVDESRIKDLVGQITDEEARIRTARLVAMVKTRKILNQQQRGKVERHD